MRTFEPFLIVVVLCAMGCGSNTAGGNDAASAPDAAAASTTDAPATSTDTGPREDSGSVMPGSPVLLSAMIVTHGTNALAWSLPDSGCDLIAIGRSLDGGAYAEVSRLSGTATEAEDFSGHGSGTFCYVVSCVLGGVTGSASNEQCVTQ